jgi:MOSC domain-containing protein YiiM
VFRALGRRLALGVAGLLTFGARRHRCADGLEDVALQGRSGAIVSLHVCPAHGTPVRPLDSANFVTDLGLEGCCHARAGSRRQVLLIEGETLAALGLTPGMVKENVTTRGIDLMSLPAGSLLLLGGEVELQVSGPCTPCGLMDEVRPGLQEELRGRRGVLARVRRGGEVRLGDSIEARAAAAEEERR